MSLGTVLITVVLLLANAFFVGAEFAAMSARRSQLEPLAEQGSRGARAASYTEEQGSAVMAQEEITIRIELGRGQCSETIWTTDLSHEYVKINAEYRT